MSVDSSSRDSRVAKRPGVRTRAEWLFIVACVVALPAASKVQQAPTITWQPDSIRMGDVTVPVERGSLRVPAVRARPTAGRITLRLLRFKSTAALPGTPIVYLAGAPGILAFTNCCSFRRHGSIRCASWVT